MKRKGLIISVSVCVAVLIALLLGMYFGDVFVKRRAHLSDLKGYERCTQEGIAEVAAVSVSYEEDGKSETVALSQEEWEPILQTLFAREYKYIGKDVAFAPGDGSLCVKIKFTDHAEVSVNVGFVGTVQSGKYCYNPISNDGLHQKLNEMVKN